MNYLLRDSYGMALSFGGMREPAQVDDADSEVFPTRDAARARAHEAGLKDSHFNIELARVVCPD